MLQNTFPLFQKFPNSFRGVQLCTELFNIIGERSIASIRDPISKIFSSTFQFVDNIFPGGIFISKSGPYNTEDIINEISLYFLVLPGEYHLYTVLYIITAREDFFPPKIFNSLLQQVTIWLSTYTDVPSPTPRFNDIIHRLLGDHYAHLVFGEAKEEKYIKIDTDERIKDHYTPKQAEFLRGLKTKFSDLF